jgi:hypothetical protein
MHVVRLLTAAVLLGTALLIVALVGQGFAAVRDRAALPPPSAGDRPVAEVLRAATSMERTLEQQPAGTTGRYPPDAAAVLQAANVLGTTAGPEPRPAGATPAGLPAGSDGPGVPGRQSVATVPKLGHLRQEAQIAMADQPVVNDADPSGGLPRSGEGLPDGAVTMAQATPGPTSRKSVGDILDPVVVAARGVLEEASKVPYHVFAPHPSVPGKSASDHAAQARKFEGWNQHTKAHAEMVAAIADFERLIASAREGAATLGAQGEQLRAAAENAKRDADRAVSEVRRDVSPGDLDPSTAPGSVGTIATAASTGAEGLLSSMREWTPDRVDYKVERLVRYAKDHAAAARNIADRKPEEARAEAMAAIGHLDNMVKLARKFAEDREKGGKALRAAADAVAVEVELARAEVRNFGPPRSSGTRPAPGRDSSLDPETAPDSGDTRHAGDGTREGGAATPTAVVEGSQPGDTVAGRAAAGATWDGGQDAPVGSGGELFGGPLGGPLGGAPGDAAIPVSAGGDTGSPIGDGDGFAGVDAGVDAGDTGFTGSLVA